jgi:hypothetical protein
MEDPTKHLVLFFDIDKTILLLYPEDSAGTTLTLCDSIAQAEKGDWTHSGHVETFKEFIYREFIQKNDFSPATRALQSNMMTNLVSYAEEHYPNIHMRVQFDHLKEVLTPYGGIAPSFIHTLTALKNSNMPYSVVLYTMGPNDSIVLNALPNHSDIRFTKRGVFEAHTLTVDDQILTSPLEMMASIKPGEHQIWRSDYHFWSRDRSPETKETSAYGKLVPFYTSPDAKNVVMMFDDNVHDLISAQREIIHPVIMDGNADVDLEALGLLVNVPPLSAALDPHFFIDKINLGLQAMHVENRLVFPGEVSFSDCTETGANVDYLPMMGTSLLEEFVAEAA